MANDQTGPAPGLGPFDIGCLAVGGIIGVGIFFTPSKVAGRCDDAAQVVFAWGLGGVLAILGGLVFAELACRVKGHGGSFSYLHAAFGPLPAFLYGWANWLCIQAGAIGVVGIILVEYLDQLLHGAARSTAGEKVAWAAVAIALFTLVNVIGLRVGKTVQNVLTVTKTLAVFSVVVIALFAGGKAAGQVTGFTTERRGWIEAIAGAILPVMFSFGGWQQASFVAGAARKPLRDVPIGILGGVAVVVLAYVTVNLAFLNLLGFGGVAQSTSLGVDAARAAFGGERAGEIAGRVLAAMIVISAGGIMNTICLAPPFVLHTMARERLFFAAVGRLHATRGVPTLAVLVQGTWSILLLGITHVVASVRGDAGAKDVLGFLLDGVVFVDWLFFALLGAALLRLRRQPLAQGFRAPGGGVVALTFSLAGLAITAGAVAISPQASLTGLLICALGWPFYALMRRQAPDHG